MICPRCNAEGAIRNGGSRGWCRTGDHGFKVTPEMAAAEAEQAKAGWAPEYGIASPVPAGFKVKGVSTLTKNPNGETQWVKTDEDRAAQEVRTRH